MAFSRDSINEIWKRSGGTAAKCFTCGRACAEGWSLDASHLDHDKNHDYDDPSRGELECLRCHLSRHVHMYYRYAYEQNKKRVRETKFACLALINRILAGEDRYDRGPIPRSRKSIKATRKELESTIKRILDEDNALYKIQFPDSKKARQRAAALLIELRNMVG